MSKIKRVEHKFYIPARYVNDIKFCLSKIMLEDVNNKKSKGYKITSLYFDAHDDQDFNQKLDGIIYREKYRIRMELKYALTFACARFRSRKSD